MTNIVTYNQLVNMFTNYANLSGQLNDFGNGPVSEISTSRQMLFPYLWLTHTQSSQILIENKVTIPVYRLTFLIADQLNNQENYENENGSNSTNEQEVISDAQLVAMDMVSYINNNLRQYGITIYEPDTLNFEPFYDETTDKVSGVRVDISLKVRYVNCTIPF